MQGSLYNNPFFGSGISSLLEGFIGNPRDVAMSELYASEAALNRDTQAARARIGTAGESNDLAGVLLAALQGGYGQSAPEVISALGSLPGSGLTPEQMAQIQVGTGTQSAGGTFPGLADTLANAVTRTGMDVQGRKDVAQMGIDADLNLAREGFDAYRNAIASIESAGSGDYSAIGPVTKSGDRAYGRYQVMGANIPDWSAAALGRPVTPDEFLANPELQDAIFDHRFGGYVDKYGPEGASRAWFSGEGGMNNPNASDGYTTNSEYGDRFMRALDPRALDLLTAAGAPGMNSNQSGILEGLAKRMMDGTDPEDAPTLSAGARTALLGALGDDADPMMGFNVVAAAEDLLAKNGMTENEALAYAVNPDNQTRGPDVTTDSWLPFDETTVPGQVTGLKQPAPPEVLQEAKAAIAAGAPPDAVMKRLAEMGYSTTGL